MPWRNLDAVIYCECPAEFEYRDGLFHIIQQAGSMCIQRVYTPHVFLKMLAGANECRAKWQLEQLDRKVVPISLLAGS